MTTVFENDDKIFDSICAVANGYILKKTHPTDMIKAIHDVLEDGAPMPPGIAR
ncbi:MAG: response regulator transcription factor [Chitinophagaceae bacterium]|nr:response regulator transcription factor [Chitinophagaceae bacterium]